MTLAREPGERLPAWGQPAWTAPETPEADSPAGILLAVDGSDGDGPAIAWARTLALAGHGRVAAVTVVRHPPATEPRRAAGWWKRLDIERHLEEGPARTRVDGVAQALHAAAIDADGMVAVGHAAPEIARAARASDAGLVVLGTRPHGPLGKLGFGSVGEAVRDRVEADVLIARGSPPPRDILVPVDGSEASLDAARVAMRLAGSWGAHATVLHVQERLMRPTSVSFASIESPPGTRRPRVSFLRMHGDPVRSILRTAAARGSGLIVVGSRGVGLAQGLLLGSVSLSLTRRAEAAVLVVKGRRAWLPASDAE